MVRRDTISSLNPSTADILYIPGADLLLPESVAFDPVPENREP